MDGVQCQQPGCGGTIVAGFCDRCGLEPAGGAAAVPAGNPGSARSSALSGRSGSARSGSRRGTGTARSSSRKHLGLGMVAVPELPPLDPEKVIMAEPSVPPHKRFCANPDCHDAQGNPTPLTRRESGFCPVCGKPYSFVPSLTAGDLVAGQYEVKGCLAFGGLGWVYLAKDATLNRWVVLKGLLNTADESAAAAAVAERQFLAAVKHANIVGIYNFVTKGSEGFIVMEYVNGTTVKSLRKDRGPLPPAEAIAYVHRILGAFAYLHQMGMVYCDMKPDNFMLEGDPPDVKLIDMGGVRRLDDLGGDIYGTRGYSAPEAGEGPTVASDLFTLGRTLAVLLLDFKFQSGYEFTIPPPAEQPVLARHESLYRFLLKATHRDPDRRFQSADEMADQLGGVLREVVAADTTPKPAESALFYGDVMALHEALDVPHADLLPDLKPDADDPGTNLLLAAGGVIDPRRRADALRAALTKAPDSAELPLRLARTLIGMEAYEEADQHLAGVLATDPLDWRATWYRGVSLLAQGRPVEAQRAFDQVYSDLPGEPAVKLAVAAAAEAAGDVGTAIRLYDLVSRTDPGFTTASFGLARCLAHAGKRSEAVDAYNRVPNASSLHTRAQMGLARALIGLKSGVPGVDDLRKASAAVEALALEGREWARLRMEVLENALELLGKQAVKPDPTVRLLGRSLADEPLRRGLEETLRQLAHLEAEPDKQIELIDRANRVRPVTWI